MWGVQLSQNEAVTSLQRAYRQSISHLVPVTDMDTLPEWSKGVDSSSTSASCVGSNPTGVSGLHAGRGRVSWGHLLGRKLLDKQSCNLLTHVTSCQDLAELSCGLWAAHTHSSMRAYVYICQDSLAEWSKALASGASPQGRGFEPHSCHSDTLAH